MVQFFMPHSHSVTVVITITSLSVTVSLQREAVFTSFTANYTTHNTITLTTISKCDASIKRNKEKNLQRFTQ